MNPITSKSLEMINDLTFDSFKSSLGVHQHALQSYHHFLEHTLSNIIHKHPIIEFTSSNQLHKFQLWFGDDHLAPPTFMEVDGTSHRLYPYEAQIRGLDYSLSHYCTIIFKHYQKKLLSNDTIDQHTSDTTHTKNDPKTTTTTTAQLTHDTSTYSLISSCAYTNVLLYKIPCKVKSNYCLLTMHGMMGNECMLDPGGFFITMGKKTIMHTLHAPRYNYPMVKQIHQSTKTTTTTTSTNPNDKMNYPAIQCNIPYWHEDTQTTLSTSNKLIITLDNIESTWRDFRPCKEILDLVSQWVDVCQPTRSSPLYAQPNLFIQLPGLSKSLCFNIVTLLFLLGLQSKKLMLERLIEGLEHVQAIKLIAQIIESQSVEITLQESMTLRNTQPNRQYAKSTKSCHQRTESHHWRQHIPNQLIQHYCTFRLQQPPWIARHRYSNANMCFYCLQHQRQYKHALETGSDTSYGTLNTTTTDLHHADPSNQLYITQCYFHDDPPATMTPNSRQHHDQTQLHRMSFISSIAHYCHPSKQSFHTSSKFPIQSSLPSQRLGSNDYSEVDGDGDNDHHLSMQMDQIQTFLIAFNHALFPTLGQSGDCQQYAHKVSQLVHVIQKTVLVGLKVMPLDCNTSLLCTSMETEGMIMARIINQSFNNSIHKLKNMILNAYKVQDDTQQADFQSFMPAAKRRKLTHKDPIHFLPSLTDHHSQTMMTLPFMSMVEQCFESRILHQVLTAQHQPLTKPFNSIFDHASFAECSSEYDTSISLVQRVELLRSVKHDHLHRSVSSSLSSTIPSFNSNDGASLDASFHGYLCPGKTMDNTSFGQTRHLSQHTTIRPHYSTTLLSRIILCKSKPSSHNACLLDEKLFLTHYNHNTQQYSTMAPWMQALFPTLSFAQLEKLIHFNPDQSDAFIIPASCANAMDRMGVRVLVNDHLIGYTHYPFKTMSHLRLLRRTRSLPHDVGITWVNGPTSFSSFFANTHHQQQDHQQSQHDQYLQHYPQYASSSSIADEGIDFENHQHYIHVNGHSTCTQLVLVAHHLWKYPMLYHQYQEFHANATHAQSNAWYQSLLDHGVIQHLDPEEKQYACRVADSMDQLVQSTIAHRDDIQCDLPHSKTTQTDDVSTFISFEHHQNVPSFRLNNVNHTDHTSIAPSPPRPLTLDQSYRDYFLNTPHAYFYRPHFTRSVPDYYNNSVDDDQRIREAYAAMKKRFSTHHLSSPLTSPMHKFPDSSSSSSTKNNTHSSHSFESAFEINLNECYEYQSWFDILDCWRKQRIHVEVNASAQGSLNEQLSTFTHCNVRPDLDYGPTLASIPFAQHNYEARNFYMGNMYAQGCASSTLNERLNMASQHVVLGMAEPKHAPVCMKRTTMADGSSMMHTGQSGSTLQVASIMHPGVVEDAVVHSKTIHDMGVLRTWRSRVVTARVGEVTRERFEKPNPLSCLGMQDANYEKIDTLSGFPRLGSLIGDGDVILGHTIATDIPLPAHLQSSNSTMSSSNHHTSSNDTQLPDNTHSSMIKSSKKKNSVNKSVKKSMQRRDVHNLLSITSRASKLYQSRAMRVQNFARMDKSLVEFNLTGPRQLVIGVLQTTDATHRPMIKIKLRNFHNPNVADKFCNLHGQKGLLSVILPSMDMPYFECPWTHRPVPIDSLINPSGLLSRMSLGELKEGESTTQDYLTPSLSSSSSSTSLKSTLSPASTRILFNINGNQDDGDDDDHSSYTQRSALVLPMHYLILHHFGHDKENMRAFGPVQSHNHQPTRGKKHHGGYTFSSMDHSVLASYGAANLIRVVTMQQSDAHTFMLCQQCGHFPSPDVFKMMTRLKQQNVQSHHQQYYCEQCRTDTHFLNMEIPYSTHVIREYLFAMGISWQYQMENTNMHHDLDSQITNDV